MCVRVAITLVIWAGIGAAQVIPLRNTAAASNAKDIGFIGVDFQELRWGHEGLDYFRTNRPPKRDAREMAEARISEQEAIGMIRFELVDESGRPLGIVPAIRTGSSVDNGDYLLRVTVPGQSFRIQITGRDTAGKPFSRIYRKLFRPGDEAAPLPQLPPGLPPDQLPQLQKMLALSTREMDRKFDTALQTDAERWLRIPRTEVAEAGYQLLGAPGGHAIGLRLHLAVRFGAGGSYSVRPHVFPLYTNTDWRGMAEMKVLDGQVTPAPKNTAADSLADVIRYGGAAQYEAGVLYRFQFDMVPRYAIRNKAGTRFCLYMEEFRISGKLPSWNAIQSSGASIRYRVDLSGLGFNADTDPVIPQRTFYESFLSEGAADCGPAPNLNF